MAKYISFLRGINVAGKNKILMADLKLLYQKLNFNNVITYIQSGNVIFETDSRKHSNDIQAEIKTAIAKKINLEVPVIVRTKNELQNILSFNPFVRLKNLDTKSLYVTLLNELPSKENISALNIIDYKPDQFEIKGKDIFIFCKMKYGKTKLSNNFFEKILKVSATTRNWKTINKLYKLMQN